MGQIKYRGKIIMTGWPATLIFIVLLTGILGSFVIAMTLILKLVICTLTGLLFA